MIIGLTIYCITIFVLIYSLLYLNIISTISRYLDSNGSDFMVQSLLVIPFILSIIKTYFSIKKDKIVTIMFISGAIVYCLFVYLFDNTIPLPVQDCRKDVIVNTVLIIFGGFLINWVFSFIVERTMHSYKE